MRVLITGMAGFLGSHIAEAMLARGHEVIGIDDLSTGRAANVPQDAELIIGDVAGLSGIGQVDLIYHCAASYKDRDAWERDARTNVLGTIAVVREAKRSGARLVYFQTSLCYGLSPASPVGIDSPLDPHGSYAVSKTTGEAYIRDSGVDWVSLRLANMYGPRNLSGAVPTFYQRLSEGRPIMIADSRRDQVYVSDLVRVSVAVAEQGHGVYHVASGTDYATADLYRAIAEAMGHSGPMPPISPRGPDDAPSILLDPSRTRDELGWKAVVPLSVGIERTVGWYREHPVTETYTHLQQRG